MRINGETHFLWRAVDHEGEVLEVFATKPRDRRAALDFLRRAVKRYGSPWSIATDRFRSYRAAMKIIGVSDRQESGRPIKLKTHPRHDHDDHSDHDHDEGHRKSDHHYEQDHDHRMTSGDYDDGDRRKGGRDRDDEVTARTDGVRLI